MIPIFSGIERFHQRCSRLHPDHFRIARAAFWIGLFTIAAKLIAAGKEIAVAWRYGRGPEVDAYNLALTLSTWLPVTLISVLTVVLVPALASLGNENKPARIRFLAELNGLGLWAALAATLFAGVFSIWGLPWYASGLDPATLAMTRQMLIAFLPLAALSVVIGVYMARMQARHDHRYALAEGLPPLAIILMLWAWWTSDSLPLLAGTLLGTALQALWLARLARHHDGPVGLAWRMKSTSWPLLWRAALIMGVGQIAMSLTTPIDQYFAAHLGTGAIATLGYANRLIGLGMSLVAMTVSRATLPVFAEAIAAGQHAMIRGVALKWAGMLLLAGFLATAAFWSMAPWLVELLFQRGAFTGGDTIAVTEALRYGVWQWPFYMAGLVFVSLLAAQRRYATLSVIAVANVACKSAGNLLLAPEIGLNGILLSTVLMYTLSTLLAYLAIRSEQRKP